MHVYNSSGQANNGLQACQARGRITAKCVVESEPDDEKVDLSLFIRLRPLQHHLSLEVFLFVYANYTHTNPNSSQFRWQSRNSLLMASIVAPFRRSYRSLVSVNSYWNWNLLTHMSLLAMARP